MTQTSPDAEPHGRFRREGFHDLGNLRRSVTDRKLGGVAGGLGRHFDCDPTVLRVIFVVLTLFGGAGALLYAVGYLVVPEEGSEHAVIRTSPSTRAGVLIAAAVIAVAVVVSHTLGHWWFPWPLAGVAVVVLLLWMNRDKKMNRTPAPPVAGPPAGQPGDPSGASLGGQPVPQPSAEDWAGEDFVVPPPPPPYYPAPPAAAPRRRRRGPLLFAPTLALLAVALGTLGLYDAVGGSVTPAAYPALALAVIGGMLVVGAWIGRAGGLIALGLAATVALLGTAAAGAAPFDAGRHLYATPTSAVTVHQRYFLPAGQIRLDLTKVPLAAVDGRSITAHTRAGEIIVVLPDNVRAHVVANVGLGDVTIDGRDTGGAGTHVVRDLGAGPTTINLGLSAGVGHIEVREAPATLPTPAPQGAGLTQGAH